MRRESLVDFIILILIFVFLLAFFSPGLLFLKTTTNGGDTGSHYPNAAYLKTVLLPQGKIMGWMPGNYAGYPLFYHYFPLPFLLMALLAFIIPLEITFKLISVLGIFFLPLFIYFAFRAMKYKFPVPILAATFTLPFLFNQGNSMWGGNIPSTLAGEFSYSIGFAFLFLFFGTLYRGVTDNKYHVLNATLIFLIGFSHAYTLIFAFVLGSFFLLADPKRNLKYLFIVYGLGLLVLSFWLLPVIANSP
ncbi:MAG: 6-pyruvoyl-tetrahydropterin synthase-related protein, partial [Candidatus Margulisbacteria bacterium]|nr:6-pyruvoyl-tetrahydropterin synthase-related protein [Candidatus Margulisiibacteriota bacterium]